MIRLLGWAVAAAAMVGAAHAQDGAPEDPDAPPAPEAVAEASEAGEAAPPEDPTEIIETAPAAPPRWPTPEPVDFVCPFKGSIDYEPGEIACGFITVPENREDPDSRLIRLHYVKIAATGEAADYRADPVIYLTGGPGVGVGVYVDRLRSHDILDQRDLYILEQRGIGASGDFCPYYGLTERALVHSGDLEEAQRNAAEVTRNCFEQAAAAGADLAGYNTVENARDVRALREALGYEQWNVWGFSYGSHLGQMLALQDPGGIRALVIDAIVPNDLTDLMRIGRWANRSLENVFATCAELDVCDDIEARLDAALDEVRGDPVMVEVEDIELYPEGEVEVSGAVLVFIPFSMAYEQDEHPAIPGVMNALIGYFETRDPDFFQLAAQMEGAPGGFTISQGMGAAIRCNDGYTQAAADLIAEDLAENPRFQGLFSTPDGAAYAARVCDEEGLSPRDRSDYRFVESTIPTLIINGAWDPITPPPLAEYIAPGFENGRYIEVPFAGHGPTRSMPACAGPVMNAFFDDPDPAALDASCLEAGVDAPEYLDFTFTRAPTILGAKAVEGVETLIAPAAWAGASLLILAVGLILIPFGFLARLVDRRPAGEIKADLLAPRWLGFLTAGAGLGFAALTGYGLHQASEVSMIALIAGLHPVAGAAPWLALASGALGLLVIIALIRRRIAKGPIRFGSLTGLFLIGAAGLALCAFAVVYDLTVL